MTDMPKLLTEPEAAEILRCSPYTVARIRKAGKLAYIPGRPVLIDEADLLAYIESTKLAAAKREPEPEPEPGTPGYDQWINEEGYRLARKMWLKRKLKAVVKG
jgi:excisionase family DNA binding protein